jgi:hypothetical protein
MIRLIVAIAVGITVVAGGTYTTQSLSNSAPGGNATVYPNNGS